VYELSLELIKALSLVYTYLLVFTLYFTYTIRVNKVFTEIIDYLVNYRKGISNTRLISSVQVTLSVSFNIIKDIIYISIFIYVIINIDLEFINDLNLLGIISQASVIVKL
jgi:hypothetical protein